MYNRYVRNDQGVYTRIPEENSHQRTSPPHRQPSDTFRSPSVQESPPSSEPAHNGEKPPPPHPDNISNSLSRTLRRLLDRFHLENVDSGDLLLLLLLFLLYREDADEELLFALGLLLIL